MDKHSPDATGKPNLKRRFSGPGLRYDRGISKEKKDNYFHFDLI
jgi:hypothetical protein